LPERERVQKPDVAQLPPGRKPDSPALSGTSRDYPHMASLELRGREGASTGIRSADRARREPLVTTATELGRPCCTMKLGGRDIRGIPVLVGRRYLIVRRLTGAPIVMHTQPLLALSRTSDFGKIPTGLAILAEQERIGLVFMILEDQ
jgi:hypothetical protein